jgi:hypothetical protein
MKIKTLKALSTTIFGLYFSVSHADELPLFKDFQYGQNISEFTTKKDFTDCSEEVGQSAICTDNIKFFGYDFTAALLFSDKKLTRVSLVSDFDESKYKTLIASLPKNGFNLVVIQGKSDRLDVIEAFNQKESLDSFKSKLTSFESVQLSQGQVTYSFVERPAVELKQYPDAVTAINKSPRQTREIDFMVEEEDTPPQMILTFSLPKVFINEIKNGGRVSEEKF